MKPVTVFFLALAIIPCLFLGSCDHPLGYTRELVNPVFMVSVDPLQNGSIRAIPTEGIAGTQITLAVNPKPGYILKADSLTGYQLGSDRTLPQNPVYRFNLNADIRVRAEFEPVAAGRFTVSVDETIQGGALLAYSKVSQWNGDLLRAPSGRPDTTSIVIYVITEPGYVLKEGSMKYSGEGVDETPVVYPYEFMLPSANITVTAEFEKQTVTGYIASGKQALLRDDYDSAVIAFEAAYQLAPGNSEAIFYSTLGSLVSIAIDDRVRGLLDDIGIGNYPSSLNNLLTVGDTWDNYKENDSDTNFQHRPGWLEDYLGIILPDLRSPSYTGYYSFVNQNELMDGTLIEGKKNMARFILLLFFDLMDDAYIDSLNDIVDDALKYVLGDAFEAAALRAAHLPYGDTITLESGIAEKLFLGKFLTSGDSIGRPELEIIFSCLRGFKAGLEWLAAYDLRFDRYIFRLWSFNAVDYGTVFPHFPGLFYEINKPFHRPEQIASINDGTGGVKKVFNDVAEFFLQNMDSRFISFPGESLRIPDMLPLRSPFLKERRGAQGMMNRAKADLNKALDALIRVYEHYYTSPDTEIPQSVKDGKSKYQWVKSALAQARDAINQGSIFYFPETLPSSGNAWPYNQGNSKYGINMGKLLTPGQFALDRLIVTETGGKRPQFFGWKDDNTVAEGTYIGNREDFGGYKYTGLKLNLKPVKEVVVKGLEKDGRALNDTEYVHTLFPGLLFFENTLNSLDVPYRNGQRLYTFYYDLYDYTRK
jgi:hypothetical protein